MSIDVAVNALGRPFQTLLCIATLLRHNSDAVGRIYLTVDADTNEAEKEQFAAIEKAVDHDVEVCFSKVTHGYFDNIEGPFDDEDYRMGIRYQYAWEKSGADYLFVAHNDCFFKGPVVRLLREAIADHIIIGHLGVCWNCPAQWAGKCSRGRYREFVPTYAELVDLYETAVPPANVKFDYRYNESDFNEKWREHPWPLPACRVNEWACLVNLKAARQATVPFGDATPFGATTYIGPRLVDTSCQWFHDVTNMGYTAMDYPIDEYIDHAHGIQQSFSPDQYTLAELKAHNRLVKEGVLKR